MILTIAPSDPIPDFLLPLKGKVEEWLQHSSIPHHLNQASLYVDEPAPHLDHPDLWPIVVTVGLLSDTTMDFLHTGQGSPFLLGYTGIPLLPFTVTYAANGDMECFQKP